MPLRLELVKKRWPTFDLPILPFLAPRVFKPWPSRGHYGTQSTRKDAADVGGPYDQPPQSSHAKLQIVKVRTRTGTLTESVEESPGAVRRKESANSTRPRVLGEDALTLKAKANLAFEHQLKGPEKARPPRRSSTSKTATVRVVRANLEWEKNRPYYGLNKPLMMKLGRHLGKAEEALAENPKDIPVNIKTGKGWRRIKIPGNKPLIKHLELHHKSPKKVLVENPDVTVDMRPRTVSRGIALGNPMTFFRENEEVLKSAMQSLKLKMEEVAYPPRRKYQIAEARRKQQISKLAGAQIPKSNRPRPDGDFEQPKIVYWGSAKWISQNLNDDHGFVMLFGSWHTRFADITTGRRPLPSYFRGKRIGSTKIPPNVKGAELMRPEIIDMIENTTPLTFRQRWANLPHHRMGLYWMELMMLTLEHHPTKALSVLVSTYEKPYPPAYAVGESLDFLVAHFSLYPNDYPQGFLDDIAENVFHILVKNASVNRTQAPDKKLSLAQHTLWLLMCHFDGPNLKRLYEIMIQINHPMHENTLIHFSYRFAKDGQTDTAFEILQRLKGYPFNTLKIQSLCTVIICRTWRDPEAIYSETQMFEFMTSCGMTPNTFTYNVLMWNSVDAGDHKTAWQIHDMMEEADIETDQITYSILLNDAKRRMDAADIGAAMSLIRQKKLVDAFLVTDVLHAIFLLHEQKKYDRHPDPNEVQTTSLQRMLPVYLENFELDHLARIIPGLKENIAEVADSARVLQNRDLGKRLMVPHDGVLTVMITAYLSAIGNAESALHFYHHFRDLVYEGDPAVETLTRTTHVWDAILMTFGRFPELVNECAHLIGDMASPTEKPLGSSPAPLDALDSTSDLSTSSLSKQPPLPSHRTPKPSLYTWSILLKIFMDNKQPLAAEKVLSMMQERDITPSIITWNTLTHGYVNVQDTDMVADAVNRLEEADFQVDESTLNTLNKLHKRRRFLEVLEEKKKRRLVKGELDKMVEKDAGEEKGMTENVMGEEWLEEEFAEGEFR